jgi:hypothetical protein
VAPDFVDARRSQTICDFYTGARAARPERLRGAVDARQYAYGANLEMLFHFFMQHVAVGLLAAACVYLVIWMFKMMFE